MLRYGELVVLIMAPERNQGEAMSEAAGAGLGLIQEPLSKMKLFIPPLRPRSVSRPRLQAQLAQGLTCKLTLISAPAGSGKSTLLTEWHATEQGRQVPLAWLSLEEADNHPARFWLYVLESLERMQPGLAGDLRLMLGTASIEQVIRLLINQLAELEVDAALVLDDYQTINADAIHRSVALLLDLLPPRFHLIMTTRVDPPLPLTRLRVRGEMVEIRLADLRFNTDETTSFLSTATGKQLTPAHVALLEERTEGWIAGLQLAALSLQSLADVDQFVKAFAGSHRYIVDYLIEEVLSHLPVETQAFLLDTSVLDRLSGPLCDAVTGRSDSQSLLEELERRNLFLVALDDHRQWYRYHHLFAEVLRTRLVRERQGDRPLLHRRASDWFESARMMEPAVNHALAAGDHERAVQLVADAAEQIWHQGQNSILMQWLEALPQPLVRSRADFLFGIAWALMTSARLEQADSMLIAAEQLLSDERPEDANLLGGVLAARAHCSRVKTEMVSSMTQTERALALLAPSNTGWRAMAIWNRASVHHWSGEFDAADERYRECLALFRSVDDLYGCLRATVWQAEILANSGRLPEALAACEQGLAQAIAQGEHLPLVALAHLGVGECLYERGDLAAAERHLEQAVTISRDGGLLDVTFLAYLPLAAVKQAQGDGRAAIAYLDAAVAVAPGVPWAQKRALTLRVAVLLAQGQVEAALRLQSDLEALALDPEQPLLQAVLALGALWIAAGRAAEAVELVRGFTERSQNLRSIRLILLEALALGASGEPEAAVGALAEALALAAPSGNVAAFRELGEPLMGLVVQTLPRLAGDAARFGQSLVAAAGGGAHSAMSNGARTAATPAGSGSGVASAPAGGGSWVAPPASGAGLAPAAGSGAPSEGGLAPTAGVAPAGGGLPSTAGPASSPIQAGLPAVPPAAAALQGAPLVEPLSEREREVLAQLAVGASNDEIARRLFITVHTAKKHVANLMGKLEAANRTQVVARARELGYL